MTIKPNPRIGLDEEDRKNILKWYNSNKKSKGVLYEK